MGFIFRSLPRAVISLGLLGLLAAVCIGVSSQWSQWRMNDQANQVFVAKDVVADILPPPMYLVEMRLILSQAVEGSVDPKEAAVVFERLVKEYEARVAHWTQEPPHGLERFLLGRQHEEAQRFMAMARSNVIEPLAKGNQEAAAKSLNEVHAQYLRHRAGVDATVIEANRFATGAMASLDQGRERALHWAVGILLSAMSILGLFAWMVFKSVYDPVARCTRMADRIAAGDLAYRSSGGGDRRDVIGRLESALEVMREQLVSLVGEVRRGAEGVSTASAQISAGNLDLSQRTESQASSLEQTAAAMQHLTDMVKRNQEQAEAAVQVVSQAADQANEGGAMVHELVDAMGRVNASSRQIGEILQVVDSLAFQTNILALNAAVEAARAGEAGRGFAVVASEVRNLAGRSREAGREIRRLIEQSQSTVEEGVAKVSQVQSRIDAVVADVGQVRESMVQIGAASREQGVGIVEVGTAIHQLDQTTQQNAALVEQTASASAGMSQQAAQLLAKVAGFRLPAGDA